MKPRIIAALPLRWTEHECADCGRIIGGPAVRVAYKDGSTVYAATYHPWIDEDDERRPCAPDSPVVRKAITHRRTMSASVS